MLVRVLFPDAPTQRGRRLLGELARARAEGHRAAVVFAVQGEDAIRLWRNSAASHPTMRLIPPLAGLCCRVSEGEVTLDAPLPVAVFAV